MAEKKVKIFLQKRCRIAGKRGELGKTYALAKDVAERLVGGGQAVMADDKDAVEVAKVLIEKLKKREAAAKAALQEPEEPQE